MLGPAYAELVGAALQGSTLLASHMSHAESWGLDPSSPDSTLAQLASLSTEPRDAAMQERLAAAAINNLRTSLEAPFMKARRGVPSAVIQQQLTKYCERTAEITLVLNDLLGVSCDSLTAAAVVANPLQITSVGEEQAADRNSSVGDARAHAKVRAKRGAPTGPRAKHPKDRPRATRRSSRLTEPDKGGEADKGGNRTSLCAIYPPLQTPLICP